jgi:rhamnulokinase
MLGHVGHDELSVEAVHRFPNEPVRTADGLHWSILELYRNVLIGLRKAIGAQPALTGIGIDSWAVDYGLVSGNRLINNPFHYRDERTARGVELVHAIADHASLYAANGLQFQPFNSIYQLAVDLEAGVIDDRTRMLMIPDLLGFWLTGQSVAERTNASTTGLLEIVNGDWNATLLEKLSLPRSLFPPLIDPGSHVGSLRDDVATDIGAPAGLNRTPRTCPREPGRWSASSSTGPCLARRAGRRTSPTRVGWTGPTGISAM